MLLGRANSKLRRANSKPHGHAQKRRGKNRTWTSTPSVVSVSVSFLCTAGSHTPEGWVSPPLGTVGMHGRVKGADGARDAEAAGGPGDRQRNTYTPSLGAAIECGALSGKEVNSAATSKGKEGLDQLDGIKLKLCWSCL